MEQIVYREVQPWEAMAVLLGLFAGGALLLGAIGLYSVMSYIVSQRVPEIALRMALGADRRSVVRLVVGHGMRLSLAGAGLGLAGAFALTRVLEGLLYDLSPTDPATLAAAAVALLGAIGLNYTRDTTSGKEGLDLLSQIQSMDSTLPVVVMTAWSSVEVAVEAMRRGARDFVPKPWDNARLLAIVRTQVELARALRQSEHLEAENELLRGEGLPKLIADSPVMRPILEMISRVGPSDANVLITGEHGTGKEVVAQTLHAISPRATKPLVSVNVGGLVEGVFESEMFGHVKGAFTGANTDRIGRFELASGGTLFLDEIANISMNQQSRLLRVIETGEIERVGSSKSRKVSVRMISATNADVRREVEEGRFREDLLFRLNTVEIHLPPLRQRKEDIPLLANHFLQRYSRRYRKEMSGFDHASLQAILDHPWPGNVRELDHALQRAVLMCKGEQLTAADLGLQSKRDGAGRIEDMSLDDVERFLIKKALEKNDGNVTEAARVLGLSRSAMYRRLQKHGL
jgi:DNA-binding NtrC family response regulator